MRTALRPPGGFTRDRDAAMGRDPIPLRFNSALPQTRGEQPTSLKEQAAHPTLDARCLGMRCLAHGVYTPAEGVPVPPFSLL